MKTKPQNPTILVSATSMRGPLTEKYLSFPLTPQEEGTYQQFLYGPNGRMANPQTNISMFDLDVLHEAAKLGNYPMTKEVLTRAAQHGIKTCKNLHAVFQQLGYNPTTKKWKKKTAPKKSQ